MLDHRGLHRPGTFLVAFIALYMPVRFALDFLRVSDVRYAGLTPAQWAALAALAALPLVVRRVRALPPRAYAEPGSGGEATGVGGAAA